MDHPRDLTGTIGTISLAIESHESRAHSAIENAQREPDDPHQYGLLDVPGHLARGLLQRYARGDSLEALRQYFFEAYIPTLHEADRLVEKCFPGQRLRLHFEQTASWMLLFALVCFDDDGSHMARLDNWFAPDCNPVLYAMLLKALVPGYTYAAQYDRESAALPHEEELVSALLQTGETWRPAFCAYMEQWPKLMKCYGYREQVDESKARFEYFPMHLALAVCAFDVDDSAFRHRPYYPHDLVDYYRARIRHTRDAWRVGVIEPGLGLPDSAKPQPASTYALSKGEAYQRWVELVCGEGPDLVEVARKALGKRKTMPSLDAVMTALAACGLGIRADLKDDDTVAAQAILVCRSWQLLAPAVAAVEQQGGARVTAILNGLHARENEQVRMAVLDDGSDNWNAVLYSRHREAEFSLLCGQLGIRRLDHAQWQ